MESETTEGRDVTISEARLARAFNAGCDARLDGWPRTSNPFNENVRKDYEWRAWERGWLHVAHNWGHDVGERWPYQTLCAVRPSRRDVA